MASKNPGGQKVITDILLEEYSQLGNQSNNDVIARDGRLNFFLATLSGAIIGIGLISQSSVRGDATNFITASIVAGIFLIGLLNFYNIMKTNFRIVESYRGMNRIRHYLVHNHKDLMPYMIFPINDDLPPFKSQFPILTAVINGIIAGVGASSLASSVAELPPTWIYLISTLISAMMFLLQYIYFRVKAQKQEELHKVYFRSKGAK